MADTLESLEIEIKHSASGTAEELKSVASAIRSVGRALDKVLPSLKVFNDLLGKKNVNVTMNDNHTTQVAETINNVKSAAAKAQSATKEAGRGIRELSKEASKSKGPLDNFVNSLKRIAFYRFIRTIIKAITQAFQEGLQNAYAFSAGISTEGHRFSSALDSMSSAGLKMKNQLGSAFIGLLAAIAPIVNAVISLITKLADALSQLFAIFTGGTYLKAADVPAKWADAAGGAAKAAKEWKNQLLAFDEINRLEEPSDPSGGGGGGGGLDPSQMFVDTPISGIFAKIRDELLEFRDSLDFEPLKRAWGELVDVASRFADMVERRVGYVWETYLKPLAKWTIEKGLPLLIEDLAKAFGLVLDVLEDLEPLINKFEENVIVPIMNWDLARVEDGLKALGEIIDKIDGLVNGDVSFDQFFNGLGDDLLKLTDWLNPVQAVFREIGEWLGTKLNVLLDGLKQQLGFSKQAWDEFTAGIRQSWDEKIESVVTRWSEIKENLVNSFNEFKEAAKKAFVETWENIKNAFADGIKAIKSVLGIHSPSTVFSDIGKNMVEGLKDGFKNMWSSFSTMASNLASTLAQTIVSAVSTAISTASANISNMVSSARSTLASLASNARESISNIVSSSRETLNGIVSSVSSALSNLISQARSRVSSITRRSYAMGGFPEDGLFYANHNELVGQFTNGKTAVANNEQIISGISEGVYQAVTMALGGTSAKNDDQPINVYIGNELVYSGYTKWAKRQQLITGGMA